MFDLLSLTPHQVSRDLRGYTVMFYGEPKSGKTTTATKFPKHLIMGFEKGWNAIPGAMAAPIMKWTEFKKMLKQLDDPAAREKFETIIIDTADIAYDYCEKYILNREGKDKIGDIPYGQGYNMVSKEFDECLRSIVQMNYGLIIISHAQDKTFTNEVGQEHNKIVPTLANKARTVCERMCDIIGYSRSVDTEDGTVTKLYMRGTTRFVAGSRFKYTPDEIVFSYKNLVNAIGDAIDKQVAEDGEDLFTDKRNNINLDTSVEIDYDTIIAEFKRITTSMVDRNPEYYAPRITEIVEKRLGKGMKVGDCTRDQAQLIDLIVFDLKGLE